MGTRQAAGDEQARYWGGDESAHWLVHEERHERMLAPFTGRLLAAAGIGRFDRVIDIGCGTGSTTRAAARVAPTGSVLGVDLSAPMLRRATLRATQDGLPDVRFGHGDAQTYGFRPDAADVAISRFGVMFFADPVAAFGNIARGLRPGGRLVFVCWQNRADNEWVAVPRAAAGRLVTLPPPDDPAAPGPFSLAERDHLTAVLETARLTDVTVDTVTEPLWLGADAADAVSFIKTTGMGKSLLRDLDPPTEARVSEAMRAALDPHVTPDGLRLGSRAWLVTARRPGSPKRARP